MKYDYVIFDGSHMLHRCVHATNVADNLPPQDTARFQFLQAKDELTDEEKNELLELDAKYVEMKTSLVLHSFLTTLFSSIRKHDANRVIIAWDEGSWRYDIYSSYKEDRKKRREDQTLAEKAMWTILHEKMGSLHELLKNHTNIISVKLNSCEGDDIVATIAMENANTLVVSSDSDFHQLLQNPNVNIYDPMKEKMVKLSIEEARYKLFFKTIRGDKSDSIPSAWPRIYEKAKSENYTKPTIVGMFNDKVMFETAKKEQKGFNEAFELNDKLINFKNIPEDVRNKILEDFSSQLTKSNSYSMMTWVEFCHRYNLKVLIEEFDNVKQILF